MDAKLSPPSARRRGPRGIRPSTLVVFGLLLLAGTLIQACSDNNGSAGPTFECREQKGGVKVLAQCTGSPAKVVGDAVGGPNGTLNIQATVTPGVIDRGRRGGVQVLLTSANGAPIQGGTVSVSSPGGKFDSSGGTTDPNGTFSTTMLVPCEVPDGAYAINVVANGKGVSLPGAFTAVTSTTNDPCAGIVPPPAGGGTGGGTVTLPTVSITASGTASETGPTSATFTVTRTGSTGAGLSVVLVASGSATFGVDYGLVGGSIVGTTVTIPAGSASVNFTLNPVNDAAAEADDPSGPTGPVPAAEVAILTISPTATYNVGAPSAAQVEIVDND